MKQVALASVLLFSACSFGSAETTVLVEPIPTTISTSTTTSTLGTTTTTTQTSLATEAPEFQLVEVGDLSLALPLGWVISSPTAAELEQTIETGPLDVATTTITDDELSTLLLVASGPESGFGPSLAISTAPAPDSIEEFSIEAIAVVEASGGTVGTATTGETSQGLAIVIASEFVDPVVGTFFVRSMHFSAGPIMYTMTIVSDDQSEAEALADAMLMSVTY